MTSMTCPICSQKMHPCFTTTILQKYSAQYEVCPSCSYLHANQPHWLVEAYSSAIAAADTGLVTRNILLASKVTGVLYWLLAERGNGRYLDAAGGYGMLTRLMRDFGFEFYWMDKYCDNLLARGFEYNDQTGPCRAVTAMEVMEYLTDPMAFVEDILETSQSDTLIFTTELYEGTPPKPSEWWYYAFPTGQHIGFFTRHTLEVLGKKLGLYFISANGIHILSRHMLSERRLKLATHPRLARIAALWIKRQLSSKTMDDHLLILKKF